jgi:hypothetical protein
MRDTPLRGEELETVPLSNLSTEEMVLARRCLSAAADGPFFPEFEFAAIFGCEREEVRDILKSWPNVDDSDALVSMAINNMFVNLLGYPHGMEPQLLAMAGAPMKEIEALYMRWLNGSQGGIR